MVKSINNYLEKYKNMIFRIKAKVVTKAGKNEIVKNPDGSWKIRVSAPPVKNKANEKVIELIAREFNTSKDMVKIVKGLRGKEKIIEVEL